MQQYTILQTLLWDISEELRGELQKSKIWNLLKVDEDDIRFRNFSSYLKYK